MTPSYSEMTRVFGRIGLLSFGGPAAQIALMHRELVEVRPWLDEETYLRALSLCMLLPGPEAMQLATYSGWRLRGVGGGLLAGGLFVLPGACVIALLVGLYAQFGDLPLVQSMFLGIKAAVIVIVLQALRNLSRKALKGRSSWVLAGLGFLAIFALNLPFPLIIASAALWGFATAQTGTTPPLPKVDIGATLKTALLWGGLWLLPLLVLSMSEQTLLADIGWFFAKLAVVTFGGAYAVLAYMTQTIVDQFGWIGTDQMIDALGLAETTPGPLILVTQFVAMLTGQLQGGAPLAIAAGIVALWATFVPCFLWIFLAAPYLDHIAARPRLAAALQAITATVVGIILNLSVWFALHVLFADVSQRSVGVFSMPVPNWPSFDPTAGIFCMIAAIWMLGLKRGLGETLLMMAGLGAAAHLV
ncbi:putative chromate transport protein [Falsiruegeria litorea R37]|uniref:Putative chromate transport protein n=1 Tax=Falsiruegeria litorea R37 TaxID=1200284 RepID=A0A1Y5SGU1_9RHOB|nr:chromate efflux transporter [Falsiruegeria litorea]SLN39320.1 putative chromate transport protein [Falsiruegeria litorea R37]